MQLVVIMGIMTKEDELKTGYQNVDEVKEELLRIIFLDMGIYYHDKKEKWEYGQLPTEVREGGPNFELGVTWGVQRVVDLLLAQATKKSGPEILSTAEFLLRIARKVSLGGQ